MRQPLKWRETLPDDFRNIIRSFINDPAVLPCHDGTINPAGHPTGVAMNMNNSFLRVLESGPSANTARHYLESLRSHPEWSSNAGFYLSAVKRIDQEVRERTANDPEFNKALKDLSQCLGSGPDKSDPVILEKIRHVFFPEGGSVAEDPDKAVRRLRDKRSVTIHRINPDPIKSPFFQILFTANVLLTIPLDSDPDRPELSRQVREGLEEACRQEQVYWYDHPVPLGTPVEKNEAIHGLKGLEEAVRFEIGRGTVPPGAKVPVLLSVSTTHEGLQAIARPYLRGEIAKAGDVSHLDLYAVTESDARILLDEILLPAARRYLPERETNSLVQIFGVDGEYGRHYSFLKGIAALWQCLVDSRLRATFKIDLDQVFPQEVLVMETGRSAFEHLSDPLWGAEGMDADGRPVRLGMLAGALVNEADISSGLFTPDVKWPGFLPEDDRWIFDSPLPQALSSEAEMMTRYSDGAWDGRKTCLQRIHVTGGTTGILIEDLRRFRPFTPTWIGRAEDQAYLMSVLFPEEGPALRYAHASGLFMRHDKKSLAAEAIQAAHVGKVVGDYVRILDFSSYARILPWEVERIKSAIDPFTGCFVSRIPMTVSVLRLAFRAAGLLSNTDAGISRTGVELVHTGCSRLAAAADLNGNEDVLREKYRREQNGWDLYYDLMDILEKRLQTGETYAVMLSDRTIRFLNGWRVRTS